MKRVYLDNNATTKTDERVLQALLPYFTEHYGNPSSIHRIGQEVRKAVEDARETIVKILGIEASELIFTSGATEANNMAIKGYARTHKEKGNHIITSQIEHESVLQTCKILEEEGFEVTYLPVDADGIVKLDDLKNAIKKETILITIMHANNEIGTIQPVEEIGKIAKEHKIAFHVDAVQTVGKISVKPKLIGADMISFSGHKFYGPKGIGGLYIKKGLKVGKLLTGGHQERTRRPGTENTPGIVGMAKALEIAAETMEEEFKREKELRDYFESYIKENIPEIIFNGHREKRLPGTLSITIKYVEGESILLNLDLKGIAVSSGSACTSGSLDPSHVILALGVPIEFAHGTIRFSLGRYNTKEEIDYVISLLPGIISKIRNMSPFWKPFDNK